MHSVLVRHAQCHPHPLTRTEIHTLAATLGSWSCDHCGADARQCRRRDRWRSTTAAAAAADDDAADADRAAAAAAAAAAAPGVSVCGDCMAAVTHYSIGAKVAITDHEDAARNLLDSRQHESALGQSLRYTSEHRGRLGAPCVVTQHDVSCYEVEFADGERQTWTTACVLPRAPAAGHTGRRARPGYDRRAERHLPAWRRLTTLVAGLVRYPAVTNAACRIAADLVGLAEALQAEAMLCPSAAHGVCRAAVSHLAVMAQLSPELRSTAEMLVATSASWRRLLCLQLARGGPSAADRELADARLVTATVASKTSASLGLLLTEHGKHVLIREVQPESPLKGQVNPGDLLVAIEGASTHGLTSGEARNRIAELPEGASCTLALLRYPPGRDERSRATARAGSAGDRRGRHWGAGPYPYTDVGAGSDDDEAGEGYHHEYAGSAAMALDLPVAVAAEDGGDERSRSSVLAEALALLAALPWRSAAFRTAAAGGQFAVLDCFAGTVAAAVTVKLARERTPRQLSWDVPAHLHLAGFELLLRLPAEAQAEISPKVRRRLWDQIPLLSLRAGWLQVRLATALLSTAAPGVERAALVQQMQACGFIKLCAQLQLEGMPGSGSPGKAVSLLRSQACTVFLLRHFPEEVLVCKICEEDFSEAGHGPTKVVTKTNHEHFRKRTCDHVFGKRCLKLWIEAQLSENSCVIRCPEPGCSVLLFEDDVQRIAGPEARAKFLELQSADHKERLLEILSGTSEFSGLVGREDTKPCPRCHVIIHRYEGCASMLCSCGHRFNWNSTKWPNKESLLRADTAAEGGAAAPTGPMAATPPRAAPPVTAEEAAAARARRRQDAAAVAHRRATRLQMGFSMLVLGASVALLGLTWAFHVAAFGGADGGIESAFKLALAAGRYDADGVAKASLAFCCMRTIILAVTLVSAACGFAGEWRNQQSNANNRPGNLPDGAHLGWQLVLGCALVGGCISAFLVGVGQFVHAVMYCQLVGAEALPLAIAVVSAVAYLLPWVLLCWFGLFTYLAGLNNDDVECGAAMATMVAVGTGLAGMIALWVWHGELGSDATAVAAYSAAGLAAPRVYEYCIRKTVWWVLQGLALVGWIREWIEDNEDAASFAVVINAGMLVGVDYPLLMAFARFFAASDRPDVSAAMLASAIIVALHAVNSFNTALAHAVCVLGVGSHNTDRRARAKISISVLLGWWSLLMGAVCLTFSHFAARLSDAVQAEGASAAALEAVGVDPSTLVGVGEVVAVWYIVLLVLVALWNMGSNLTHRSAHNGSWVFLGTWSPMDVAVLIFCDLPVLALSAAVVRAGSEHPPTNEYTNTTNTTGSGLELWGSGSSGSSGSGAAPATDAPLPIAAAKALVALCAIRLVVVPLLAAAMSSTENSWGQNGGGREYRLARTGLAFLGCFVMVFFYVGTLVFAAMLFSAADDEHDDAAQQLAGSELDVASYLGIFLAALAVRGAATALALGWPILIRREERKPLRQRRATAAWQSGWGTLLLLISLLLGTAPLLGLAAAYAAVAEAGDHHATPTIVCGVLSVTVEIAAAYLAFKAHGLPRRLPVCLAWRPNAWRAKASGVPAGSVEAEDGAAMAENAAGGSVYYPV